MKFLKKTEALKQHGMSKNTDYRKCDIATIAKIILNQTENRQYPLPRKPWVLYQEWHEVLLFHWPVDPELVKELLPDYLELDTIKGKAYLSIVGFTVKNFRTALVPLPFISSFGEINIRTYVTHQGIKGIYFFSLHTEKLLAVWGAQLLYQLPYRKAEIIQEKGFLYGHNHSPPFLNVCVNYTPEPGRIEKNTLDKWLTERHAFYQEVTGNLYRCDIHHKEWPLQRVILYSGQIKAGAGQNEELMLNGHPVVAHYASCLRVLFWSRIKI